MNIEAPNHMRSITPPRNGKNGRTKDTLLSQLEYQFPQRSWAESGVAATTIAIKHDKLSLLQGIDTLLIADLILFIINVNGHDHPRLISVVFPDASIERRTTFGLLDWLGIGPEESVELAKLYKHRFESSPSTLAALLNGCDKVKSSLFPLPQALLDHIKIQMMTTIQDIPLTNLSEEELQKTTRAIKQLSFAEIMVELSCELTELKRERA